MTAIGDIRSYLDELEDIPGTVVFTARRARLGYALNQFCMRLMDPANRERFRKDERAFLDESPLSEEQKQALLDRDYNRLIALGGNIYFLVKIMSTDGVSVAKGVSSMTGMSFEDYTAMMIAGGRSPEGQRSIRDQAAPAGGAFPAAGKTSR